MEGNKSVTGRDPHGLLTPQSIPLTGSRRAIPADIVLLTESLSSWGEFVQRWFLPAQLVRGILYGHCSRCGARPSCTGTCFWPGSVGWTCESLVLAKKGERDNRVLHGRVRRIWKLHEGEFALATMIWKTGSPSPCSAACRIWFDSPHNFIWRESRAPVGRLQADLRRLRRIEEAHIAESRQ